MKSDSSFKFIQYFTATKNLELISRDRLVALRISTYAMLYANFSERTQVVPSAIKCSRKKRMTHDRVDIYHTY